MTIEPKFLSLRRRRQLLRVPHMESLESRIALSAVTESGAPIDLLDERAGLQDDSVQEFPGGVTVTDTHILTKAESIPRFVAEPTITTIRSGFWFDPTIWSLGRVPTNGDRVAIPAGESVWYSVQSDARIDGLEISGSLIFSPTDNTRLVVADLTVMPTGLLQIGTATAPIAPWVKAELVFADEAIDTALDPQQFGTGLIGLGTITFHGAEVESTWVTLGAEAKAGDDSLLMVDSPEGWRAGDRIIIPDSRQVRTTQQQAFRADELPQQWEEATIARVEGQRVYLETPLLYDHLGARLADGGDAVMLPHAALLSRNMILRSENPQGTRGHTMFTARADTDIAYAHFQDLGRTDAFRPVDNTRFDENGNVTHIGTNQIARYAVHYHHLMGPENPDNVGYQFKLTGNTVERSRKWAVTVHGASFGLVDQNVVYDAQGAGIVTEDGSELGNLISNNITIRIQGTHLDGKSGTAAGDYGRGGSGFWFRRGGNMVIGNVAANNTYAGFVIDGYNLGTVVLPVFRGAEKGKPGQGIESDVSPLTYFADNQAYGLTRYGLWMAFPSGSLEGAALTYFFNLRLWHITHTGVVAYHTAHVTFDQLFILGDRAAQNRNDSGTRGMDLKNYENRDLLIRFSRIEGLHNGIIAPVDSTYHGIERPTIIQNSTLKNYINIVVSLSRDSRPSNGNVIEVRDVKFDLLTALPDGPISPDKLQPPANIHLKATGEDLNFAYPSIVRVYNYNQVAGDNFQVFYREQDPSFVLPQTDPALVSTREAGVVGSPEAGLTNAENLQRYGIAMAGSVAPVGASASRPEINGLVGPLQDTSATPPRVVLVTPWDLAPVVGGYVRIRHYVVGSLPPGAHVYMQLDNSEPTPDPIDGGLFGVTPGLHALHAYVGDAFGNVLPGTSIVTRRIFAVSQSAN